MRLRKEHVLFIYNDNIKSRECCQGWKMRQVVRDQEHQDDQDDHLHDTQLLAHPSPSVTVVPPGPRPNTRTIATIHLGSPGSRT